MALEYLDLLSTMQAAGIRGEVSLKPTQFGVLIDRAYALSEMIPVLEATKANGRVLWLDMESANTTDDTVWICEQLLTRYDRVGICLQANLKRTADDLDHRAFTRTMRILESWYPVEDWARGMTPFEILISTILSQSTTVANERRGLNDLRLRVGAITPKRLAETPQEEIAKAIWHAGLAKQKAPRIRGVAKALLDGHGDRLERILGLPTERAREELMALRGVGPKTADVVLAMAGGHPTFAVDTHIARIARRWNLVRQSDY